MLALVLPPLTQLNTPYPSTAYLGRFLRDQGVATTQRDIGLEWVLRLFSRRGLTEVFDALDGMDELPEPAWQALAQRERHQGIIDGVIRFLQGKDRTLAWRIAGKGLLPAGPRLQAADFGDFGRMGTEDAARHAATLYLSDLADLVTSTLDLGFGLARYQHHLATGAVSFDPLAERLGQTTLLDRWLDELGDSVNADAVALSVPFPGNLYGALRLGRRFRARGIPVWMGGGYVNTELREVNEPRLWDHIDALCYDDGEGPLLALWEHLQGRGDRRHRTLTREGRFEGGKAGVTASSVGWYGDLALGDYLQLVDTLNPAHRLWADGRWNKITLAHGCYWKKCTFCDVNLDYVGRFEAAKVEDLVEKMVEVREHTGISGFHFVDEAAPPRSMKALALALLARGEPVTWWGNIRFERAFTPDLCRLLAAAGLVGVTGGLEVASDRLLQLIDKGVTIDQVARASKAFRDAGVFVHAYLMYGFPSQTVQETVDAAEVVRQLFSEGCVDSAFWHRFVLTRHSPIFQDPARFGVTVLPQPDDTFARNDLEHDDGTGIDHERFDGPLVRSLQAWMRGRQLDRPVHKWFEADPVPRTLVPPDRIRQGLRAPADPGRQFVWVGGDILDGGDLLVLHHGADEHVVEGPREALDWLSELIEGARPGGPLVGHDEAMGRFPGDFAAFREAFGVARRAGLLLV